MKSKTPRMGTRSWLWSHSSGSTPPPFTTRAPLFPYNGGPYCDFCNVHGMSHEQYDEHYATLEHRFNMIRVKLNNELSRLEEDIQSGKVTMKTLKDLKAVEENLGGKRNA